MLLSFAYLSWRQTRANWSPLPIAEHQATYETTTTAVGKQQSPYKQQIKQIKKKKLHKQCSTSKHHQQVMCNFRALPCTLLPPVCTWHLCLAVLVFDFFSRYTTLHISSSLHTHTHIHTWAVKGPVPRWPLTNRRWAKSLLFQPGLPVFVRPIAYRYC